MTANSFLTETICFRSNDPSRGFDQAMLSPRRSGKENNRLQSSSTIKQATVLNLEAGLQDLIILIESESSIIESCGFDKFTVPVLKGSSCNVTSIGH